MKIQKLSATVGRSLLFGALMGALTLSGCQNMERKSNAPAKSNRAKAAKPAAKPVKASAKLNSDKPKASPKVSPVAMRETKPQPSNTRTVRMQPRERDGLQWEGLAFPTGDRGTSAIYLDKGQPTEVQAGQDFEYRLQVENLTDHVLENVEVADQLPSSFSFQKASPAPQSQDDGDVRWLVGDLGPGQRKLIKVTGKAEDVGLLTSCASVSYNTSVCTVVQVVQPAIQITRSAPAQVLLCEPIPVRYVVTNTGTGTARNVQIMERLEDCVRGGSGKIVRFDIPSLEAGQSREFTANLEATETCTFSGTAKVVADGDLSDESDPMETMILRPALEIAVSCPEETFIGRKITHEIEVKNVGDGEARDTTVECPLPLGARFVEASDLGRLLGSKIVWDLGTLNSEDARNLTVTYAAEQPTAVRTAATARAFCAEAATDNCVTRAVGIPAVLLEVVDLEDPILVGENVTYEIRVTNQGTAPGTNIKIACELEGGMAFLNTGGISRGNRTENDVTFEPLSSLAPKASATWTLTVRASEKGSVRFKVKMTSDQIDRPVEETEATNFYQ